MQKINFIAAFILACLYTMPVNAELPDKIQGNWSLPDCRSPEKIIINTKNLSLKISSETMSLTSIKQITQKKDYSVISYNETKMPIRVFNDGIMEIAYLDQADDFKNSWDNLLINKREEYMRCYEISSSPHLSGMNAIYTLEAHCTNSDNKSCINTLKKMGVSIDSDTMKQIGLIESTDNNYLESSPTHISD